MGPDESWDQARKGLYGTVQLVSVDTLSLSLSLSLKDKHKHTLSRSLTISSVKYYGPFEAINTAPRVKPKVHQAPKKDYG